MKSSIVAILAVSLISSCATTFDKSRPTTVEADASYASAYWFRGTPVNVKGVYQGSVSASMPTADGGALGASSWVNIDAGKKTGDAISPDGNQRDFTEVDFTLDYSKTIGEFDTTAGFISYHFPNGVGGSTLEAYFNVAQALSFMDHGLTLYWDVDELGGFYATYDASRSFELAEDWVLSLSALAGYMDGEQAEFYFGLDESGVSDVVASATVEYQFDEMTTFFFSANGVTPLDSDLQDALDDAGLEDSGAWFAIGASWGF